MSTPTHHDERQATLAYEVHGAGVPVVLLHGLTFDRTTWRPVVERLTGVRTIAVDLPGHGESAGPPCTLEELAGRLHDLLGSLDVERPVVAGHSLSGSLAPLYASLHPTLGVVIVDQGVDLRDFAALSRRLEPALRGDGFAAAFQPFQESMGIELLPEPQRSLVLGSQRIRRELVLGYWEELMRADADELQARIDTGLAEIDVPCLAIFGHTLADGDRRRLALIRDLELHERPGAGHFVHLADPDWFTARLLAFVERCAGA